MGRRFVDLAKAALIVHLNIPDADLTSQRVAGGSEFETDERLSVELRSPRADDGVALRGGDRRDGCLAEGEDGMKIAVDVAPADGAAQHWEMTVHYDGKEYPVTGNPNADMMSAKKIDDHTGESTFKKDGKVTATNVRKLSADGKTLTITSKGTTVDGKPRHDVQVFEKS